MRFLENGPSIPHELLTARDEGRVVFFCGAGVSRAKAGLPDFFGLAESVLRQLGVQEDNDAYLVLRKAWEIGDDLDVTGLISADRVFGLLEREFSIADIQAAVARSLTPTDNPDLSAHQLILRVARTTDSKIQLVTTNFDRLFDDCAHNKTVYQPPRLPNPSRFDDLDGIVYLHGRVNETYSCAEGDGFILSSSDFGYAYLSEGWATEFFREIVRNYVVVFVGYSADDPPIHYLLEGLRRIQSSSRRIYAFQAQESGEAVARWLHKGVEAIPYSPDNSHSSLWETFELWAQRADAPHEWRQNTIKAAMSGPANLKAFQRGQIAHVVSTKDGAREFSESSPPAEWLCVFDPACRFAKPEKLDWYDPESAVIDPFVLYGLDSDAVPERADPTEHFVKREIPVDAWDAFSKNSLDYQNPSDESLPAVRGYRAKNYPRLSKRLEWLGAWIGQVANQPATVWWFARQDALHSHYRHVIRWKLDRIHEQVDPVIRKAWRYLLEVAKDIHSEPRREWYGLKRQIDLDGWGPFEVRQLTEITRPYFKVSPALMAKPSPPPKDVELRLWDLVRIEVECPVLPRDADIPDDWLELAISEMRQNIARAIRLCEEVDAMHRFHISPIVPEDDPEISDIGRNEGLSGCVLQFASLFDRLIELDVDSARRELATWPTNDDTAFCRLRIWVGGKPDLTTGNGLYQTIKGLSTDVFWDDDHQRDLLLVMAKRWSDISERSRKQIENRLLSGPEQWEGEDATAYAERNARRTLGRLQWLANKGCTFTFDLDNEISKRSALVPNWKPEYAETIADSREVRVGFVQTNTDHSILANEPIDTLLAKAQEMAGKSGIFRENDPFAGLCTERPQRAYLAIVRAAKSKQYPVWAWKKFLDSPARDSDDATLMAAIAERIAQLPDNVLRDLLYPCSYWLKRVAKSILKDSPKSFEKACTRLMDILQLDPKKNQSAILRSSGGRDLAMEALNSPAGHIAMSILEDPRLEHAEDSLVQTESWNQLARLLSIGGESRRQAIVMMCHHLRWLVHVNQEWTEQHLLVILDKDDDDDKQALWAGFLWNARIGEPNFYLRLKPGLLQLAKSQNTARRGHVQSLAYLVMQGWIPPRENVAPLVSDVEFRDVLLHAGDDFRSNILWQIERWLDSESGDNFDASLECAKRFFTDVWPRQMSVKTPTMTVRLCEMLLSNKRGFTILSPAVLPLLTKLPGGFDTHLDFRVELDEMVAEEHESLLQLLHTILPDDVAGWPYRIGDVIERLDEALGDKNRDARFRELKRKWNSR